MFSKTTEYAIRATIFIAKKSDEQNKLGIEEIANAIDSPKSFTGKILQLLTKDNKIVSSVRGPNGGFFVTAKAKKLPVLAVLEATGESEILKKCVMGLKLCSETQPCPMHLQYKVIKNELLNLFLTKTIEQLASETKEGQVFLNNKRKKI